MRHKIISVSKAKAKLLELARSVDEEGQAYLLIKDGTPLGALIPMETYEALLETSDVLSDRATRAKLTQALKDEKKGRLWKRDSKGQWVRVKETRAA